MLLEIKVVEGLRTAAGVARQGLRDERVDGRKRLEDETAMRHEGAAEIPAFRFRWRLCEAIEGGGDRRGRIGTGIAEEGQHRVRESRDRGRELRSPVRSARRQRAARVSEEIERVLEDRVARLELLDERFLPADRVGERRGFATDLGLASERRRVGDFHENARGGAHLLGRLDDGIVVA